MKRTFTAIAMILTLILVCSFFSAVHAHSGGTDSQGGHYNSATGKYHYHHGYPAHNHYDIDGDGTIDCPHSFVDKTDNNNNSYNSDTNSYYNGFAPQTTPTIPVVTIPADSKRESEAPIVNLWIVCIIVSILLTIILFMMNRLKNKNREIITLSKEFQENLKKDRASIDSQLAELSLDIAKVLGSSYLYSLVGAPAGNYIDKDGLPTGPDALDGSWGERYTFYTAKPGYPYSRKYHRSCCRYANLNNPINAYKIKGYFYNHIPCMLCHPTIPDTSWVDRFLKYKTFFEEHGISVPIENRLQDESYKKYLSHVTQDMVEDFALTIGTDVDTALRLINHTRQSAGLPVVSKSNLKTQKAIPAYKQEQDR